MLLRAHSLRSFLHAFNVSPPGRPALRPLEGASAGAGPAPAAGAPGAPSAHEACLPPEREGTPGRFRGEDGMALLSALAG